MGPNTPTPSRRSLLALIAAAAATPALATPHPDAELLAMSARLAAIEAESIALSRPYWNEIHEPPEVGDLVRELVDEGWELRDAMAARPARTRAGIEAKARAAMIFIFPEDMFPGNDWALASSVLADLVGWPARPDEPADAPAMGAR